MKIELKSIKHSEFASHETHCYQAKLFINGKAFAFVENDGHGGCDNVYPLNNLPQEAIPAWRENLNVIEAWLHENGKTETYGDTVIHENLEMRCCDLVNQWLQAKEAKRILRKVAYIRDGDIYTIPPSKAKPTPDVLAKIKACSWWTEDMVLLNELPQGEAIDLINQHLG